MNHGEPSKLQWLDKWCALRWRALATWVVLSTLMCVALNFGVGDAIYERSIHFASKLGSWLAIPWHTLASVWIESAALFVIMWFQSVLLRLSTARTLGWIALSCILPAATQGLTTSSETYILASSCALAFTGLALIGWRTRPWMTVVAAMAYSAVLLLTANAPIRGLPALALASLPHGAILLYGTRLLRYVDGREPMPQRLNRIEVRRRLLRILGGVVVLSAAWISFVAYDIWQFGSHDNAERSDCAIVLGAAVNGTRPSPVFEERIRHAIELYRQGVVPKIIFTGGKGEGAAHAESEVARQYAIEAGVAEGDILVETRSRTTHQNLAEAKALMDEHVLKSAVIVSDPLHLRRAHLMAKLLGIYGTTSPTPTTRYRSAGTQLRFLTREIYFLHHYVITGD
jgi:uncharacterized SAM-binding protein YcdF (DUF218 family)